MRLFLIRSNYLPQRAWWRRPWRDYKMSIEHAVFLMHHAYIVQDGGVNEDKALLALEQFKTLKYVSLESPDISLKKSESAVQGVEGEEPTEKERLLTDRSIEPYNATKPDGWHNSFGKYVECTICLVPYQTGDQVKLIPGCEHLFHIECLKQWLTQRLRCPNCNVSLENRGHNRDV